MNTNKYLKNSILFFIAFLMAGCSGSRYSLQDPHQYENNFDEVLAAITEVLTKERMAVVNADYQDENTYQIFFYKKSPYIQERDYEYGATATMIVTKIDSGRTSIQIKEKRPDALVKTDYQEHLARDVFRALEKVLVLEPKLAQK